MTFTFSFFFGLGTLATFTGLLDFKTEGSSDNNSPPLARVDLVLILPALAGAASQASDNNPKLL